MLTKSQHRALSMALEASGYAVEAFNPQCPDVLDIWSPKRSQGFIEVTVTHAAGDYVVLCPVDYEGDEGLIEVHGSDVSELVRQLNVFYAKGA